MPKLTVTISEELAALVKERQKKAGLPTPDDAAASLITEGLLAQRLDEDHSAGLSDDELRRLIDEADAGGPPELWDAASTRAEILHRVAAGKKS